MKRFQITAIACQYTQATLKLSGRAISRALKIHHRTWQDCHRGNRQPSPEIKKRLASLMHMENFNALVSVAYRHHLRTLKFQRMKL